MIIAQIGERETPIRKRITKETLSYYIVNGKYNPMLSDRRRKELQRQREQMQKQQKDYWRRESPIHHKTWGILVNNTINGLEKIQNNGE